MGLKPGIYPGTPTPLLYQVLLCGLYPQSPAPRPSSHLDGTQASVLLIRGSLGVRVEQQSIPSGRPVQAAPCPETRARAGGSFTSCARQRPPQPQCPWKTPLPAPWAAHTHLMTVGVISAQKNTLRLPTAWEANMPTMEKVMENLSLTLSLIPGGEPGR